uniref:uncharacterized protein LOC120332590 n=1 Tax=Styela clava TaxID=7725 RepID=UPI00193A4265|nr:uncharacterized protein LOC120332590 [Styela clava]
MFVIHLIMMLILHLLATEACWSEKPQDIDWSKLTGNWYNSLVTHDDWALSNKCVLVNVWKATDNGVTIKLHPFPKHGLVKDSITHELLEEKEKPGWYHIKKDSALQDIAIVVESVTKSESTIPIANLIEARAQLYMEPLTFVTDYSSYLLAMACNKDGETVAWINTRDRTPNHAEKRILRILARFHGIKKKMYETKCNEIKLVATSSNDEYHE